MQGREHNFVLSAKKLSAFDPSVPAFCNKYDRAWPVGTLKVIYVALGWFCIGL